jgi:hypothetical protein
MGERTNWTEKVVEDHGGSEPSEREGGKDHHSSNHRHVGSILEDLDVVARRSEVRVFAGDIEEVDSDPVYQRLKLCKRGYREATLAKVCGVRIEGLPMWLWTIRLAEWSTIYITSADEVILRQYHVSTWDYVRSRLVLIEDGADKLLPEVDIWLISGTLEFIASLDKCMSTCPRLVWISDGGRRTPKSVLRCFDWKTIIHSKVGGMTKATAIFGIAGLDVLDVNDDPIRRTIGHIIKYSVRPKPCTVPVDSLHYKVSDRLSLHDLSRPVVFESGFSRSGWGVRPLVEAELAHAFDLPPFVSWSSVENSHIVPIHMFRVALDSALANMMPASQPGAGGRARMTRLEDLSSEIGVAPLPLDRAWLPQLQRWLPGSWAETAISDKAVKADNAAVEFHPWHQRIMLLFPVVPGVLVSFEEFALRRWRRALTGSFRDYLTLSHGVEWRAKVTLLKADRGVSGLSRAPHEEPPTKRRRLVLGEDTPSNDEGGTENRPEQQRSDRDLLLDFEKGGLVLEQVLQSKWWEWRYGSALFFWRWNGREQITAARDGMKMFVHRPLPIGRKRRKKVRLSTEMKVLVSTKIEGMRKRYYLESGFVSNTLNYFAVPKGECGHSSGV